MRYTELEQYREEDFIQRHIGPDASEVAAMLDRVGFSSLDQMTRAILPESIQMGAELDVCPPASEASLLAIM